MHALHESNQRLMYASIHESVHAWMHACPIHEHAYMCTCVRSFIRSFIHSCLRRGHLHADINSWELTDQRMSMRTCTCVCMYVYARMHACTRMYIIIFTSNIIIFLLLLTLLLLLLLLLNYFYYSYYEYVFVISVLKLKRDHFTTYWYV